MLLDVIWGVRTPALTLPVSVQREEAVSNALEELKLQVV